MDPPLLDGSHSIAIWTPALHPLQQHAIPPPRRLEARRQRCLGSFSLRSQQVQVATAPLTAPAGRSIVSARYWVRGVLSWQPCSRSQLTLKRWRRRWWQHRHHPEWWQQGTQKQRAAQTAPQATTTSDRTHSSWSSRGRAILRKGRRDQACGKTGSCSSSLPHRPSRSRRRRRCCLATHVWTPWSPCCSTSTIHTAGSTARFSTTGKSSERSSSRDGRALS